MCAIVGIYGNDNAASARDLDLDTVRVSGRDGQIGARTKDEIAVMALRGRLS